MSPSAVILEPPRINKKSEAEALVDGVESSVGDLTDSEIMAIKELAEGVKI